MVHIDQINPHACKTYLVRADDDKRVSLVDPVLDHLNDYRETIDREGLTLVSVVDTHTHADHISAGPALRDVYDCDYVMHTLAPSKCANIRVADGDALALVDGVMAEVLHTPGHTRDSVSLVCDGVVLTGDALFAGGIGRCDLPGASARRLLANIRDNLYALPPETKVLPGHGPATTIAAEMQSNPFVKG